MYVSTPGILGVLLNCRTEPNQYWRKPLAYTRKNRSRKRPRGYSEHTTKPLVDLYFRSQGVQGREKREALNATAGVTAVFIGGFCGVIGFLSFGIIGGFIGFFAGLGGASSWLTKNRFYR